MFNNLCRYREKANAAGKDTNNESINAPIVIIMLFKSPGKNLGLSFASLEKFFNVGRVKIFGGYTHRSRGFLNEFIIMRNIGKKAKQTNSIKKVNSIPLFIYFFTLYWFNMQNLIKNESDSYSNFALYNLKE